MQLGKFILGASIVLSAAASAQAEITTSTWTDWTTAGNPGVSGDTGTLTSDASSQFPATLTIDNSGSLFGGLYTDYYYTGNADADLALSSALQSGDVSSLTLSVDFTGNAFAQTPTLTIDGQTYAFDTQDIASSLYTFTWNLSGIGAGAFAQGAQYEFEWTFDAHVAFTMISTAQATATAAVPEPATYAMMLTGLAGVGAMASRRRGRRIVA
jgi:hypothetical protein